MTNKHLWIRRLSSLLLVTGVVITGCGSTVDDQDAGPRCPTGEIFAYNDRLCGKGDSAGHCREPAISCDAVDLTCGCDGTVYQSVCEAHQAGVDFTFADQCTAPPDVFACGYAYCSRNTTFCNEIVTDADEFSEFNCEGMVAQCASAPSCECLAEWWSDDCESDGMGAFYTTSYMSTGS